MESNRIKGIGHQVKGAVIEGLGKVIGDAKLAIDGAAERAIGDEQNVASAEGDQLIGVDADRIKGIAHQVKGALIQGFGAIVGNPQLAADGVAEQVAGKAQNAAGSVGTMDAKTARRFLDRWNAWVQVCDLGPMKRLAKTIMAKAEGILRSIATGLSNGVLEAINGNVQAAKRKAKGSRTKRNLKTIVYLIAGDVLANSPT